MNVKLVRTRGGSMVHRADCKRIKSVNIFSWEWADDKTEDEIIRCIIEFGYRTCKDCKPLGFDSQPVGGKERLGGWHFIAPQQDWRDRRP